jgi:hypothetical protein
LQQPPETATVQVPILCMITGVGRGLARAPILWLMRSTALGRVLIGAGLAILAAAVVLALWPMHGNGLGGNAARPRYSAFGWYAYGPLPVHPTLADLRHAGVTIPQDVVAARRLLVASIATAGVVVTVLGALRRYPAWRRRQQR